MSCPHGNHADDCELCDALDEAFRFGYEVAKKYAAALCEAYIVPGIGRELAEAIRSME